MFGDFNNTLKEEALRLLDKYSLEELIEINDIEEIEVLILLIEEGLIEYEEE